MAGISRRDVVVIGASAGGVEALRRMIGALPADLDAAVCVVMHIPATGDSVLPKILDRRGRLPAVHATDGARIENGRIYVAPPDRHLLLERGRVRLGVGPRHNGHRPAVDPLFSSAALSYGARVIAVVLSGTLDDGAAGALDVKRRGGVVAVQDPDDATYPGMPRSVMDATGTDLVAPAHELADLVVKLSQEQVDTGDVTFDPTLVVEQEMMLGREGPVDARSAPAEPSEYVCPDCGGTLYHTKGAEIGRFRCRVGHIWSPGALLAQQSRAVENALWMALRSLQERADMSRRLADPARKRGHVVSADMFLRSAEEADRAVHIIRGILDRRDQGEQAVEDAIAAGETADES